jgi:hypothetical protein
MVFAALGHGAVVVVDFPEKFLAGSGLRQLHPRETCELLDSFGEVQPLGLHDKVDRIGAP